MHLISWLKEREEAEKKYVLRRREWEREVIRQMADRNQSLCVCVLRSWLGGKVKRQMERKDAWGCLRWKKPNPAKGEKQKRQKRWEELETGEGTNVSDTPGKFLAFLPGAQLSETVSKRGWGWGWRGKSSEGRAQLNSWACSSWRQKRGQCPHMQKKAAPMSAEAKCAHACMPVH